MSTGDAAPTRVTAIGGGHGLSRTLAAARILGWRPTAVVSVADDGGSSGRLRRAREMVPPGDLRMALSTLCPDPLRRALLEHRFGHGELAGHALGNLVLVAGADLRGGDLTEGLRMLAEMLGAHGTVLPVSHHPVHLRGHLRDGSVVDGQRALVMTSGIERVELVGAATAATPDTLQAIHDADVVVLGPGSWFTSVIPPLLADGVGDALAATSARVVVVANIRQQRDETSGLDMDGHMAALRVHLPDEVEFDVVVANDGPVPAVATAAVDPLAPPTSGPGVHAVLTAALADARGNHEPAALARALLLAVESPHDEPGAAA